MNILPLPTSCCVPQCAEVEATQITGPAGADGAAGADGQDGVNAYTYLSASFVMPAEAGTVSVLVLNTSFMVPEQILFVQGAGWMKVASVTDNTTVVLENIENSAALEYTDNSPPGTTINAGSKVSPGGLQGPVGAAGSAGAAGEVQVFSGHYAGAAPSDVPTTSAAIAYDLDPPNNDWRWDSGASAWV